MCEPKSSGGMGVVGVVSAAAVGVAVWVASGPGAASSGPDPKAAVVVAHAGFPWLAVIATASVTIVVMLAGVLVVRLVRGRRRDTVVEAPPVVRRPMPVRELEAAPESAQEWLNRTETR